MSWAACVQVCSYVCQCTHTCRFTTCLSPQDFWDERDGGKDDRWLAGWFCLKWRRIPHYRPHFLVRGHLNPVARQSQDNWRQKRMQWMAVTSYVSCYALCAPQSIAGNHLSAHWTTKSSFLCTVCRIQASHTGWTKALTVAGSKINNYQHILWRARKIVETHGGGNVQFRKHDREQVPYHATGTRVPSIKQLGYCYTPLEGILHVHVVYHRVPTVNRLVLL